MIITILDNQLRRVSIPCSQITFAIGRSILALGTFLSILCNDSYVLFYSNSRILENATTNSVNHINLFYYFRYENILYAKIIALIILLSVIIGYLPRITCFLHWWVSFSYLNAVTLIEGGDQITMILTFFLIPIMFFRRINTNHWSISDRKSNIYSNIIQHMTLSVIRIQMALLYLHAAVGKTKVPEWIDGTSLYYWFNHPTFGFPAYLGFALTPIINSELILPLVTWGVIAIEFCLFGALFAPERKYKYFLLLGFLFHFSIIFIHGLPNFFLAMFGGLVLYLGGFWLESLTTKIVHKMSKLFKKYWSYSTSQYTL